MLKCFAVFVCTVSQVLSHCTQKNCNNWKNLISFSKRAASVICSRAAFNDLLVLINRVTDLAGDFTRGLLASGQKTLFTTKQFHIISVQIDSKRCEVYKHNYTTTNEVQKR